MVANFAKELWRVYPNCRLHVEITEAGTSSYKVVVTVLDAEKKIVQELEHYGSGDLFTVKAEAVQAMLKKALADPA